MIGGLVFDCGGCGNRLQAITDGRDEFAAQLKETTRTVGSKIVGLYNEPLAAMAVLGDDEGVTCPYCKKRNVFPPGSEGAERN